jgi:4-oxalocrotonate tautomerase
MEGARMPHIVVKMYPGRTAEQKTKLAEALSRAMIDSIGTKEEVISVGIEDVMPDDWMDEVAKPEIQAKANTIYKKPGYEIV